MRTSVVVVHWGEPVATKDCVSTLLASAPGTLSTVRVVDNASPWPYRDDRPGVEVVRLPINLGFPGGAGVGIASAIAAGDEVITVSNNDVLVNPDVLSTMMSNLDMACYTAVSPIIRSQVGWWYCGGDFDQRTGRPLHWLEPRDSMPYATPFMSGCFVMATCSTWQRAGSFDPSYFLLFEDADWSVKAIARGVELLVDPRCAVSHSVSHATEQQPGPLTDYYFVRNGVSFNWRARLPRHRSRRCLAFVVWWLRSIIQQGATARRAAAGALGIVHAALNVDGIAPAHVRKVAGS